MYKIQGNSNYLKIFNGKFVDEYEYIDVSVLAVFVWGSKNGSPYFSAHNPRSLKIDRRLFAFPMFNPLGVYLTNLTTGKSR